MGVFYHRPAVKGRSIFGGLIPFGEVWRTGAIEATVFYSYKTQQGAGKIVSALLASPIILTSNNPWG